MSKITAVHHKGKKTTPTTRTESPLPERKRVAVYCRVSTHEEEQNQSYEAQQRYYKTLFEKDEKYILIGVYGDEGISGRLAAKRPGFQELLRDCRQGLIDEVYTKSISRFARNYSECVEYVRELKKLTTEAWEAHVESPRRMTNPGYVTLQRSSGIGIALMRCGYPVLGLYIFAMYSYFKRSINRGLIINLIGTLILVLGLVNEPIQFTPIFLLSFFTWRTADKEGEIRNV